MDWATAVSLIIQFGFPLADKIITNVLSGGPVTQADWKALRAEASQTARDRMKVQLVAAGIDLNSQQAIAMLAMSS